MQQAARMRGCSLHWNDHVSVFWRCLRYSAGYSSLSHGPGLRDFLGSRTDVGSSEAALLQSSEHRPKVFLKTYGCQMNVSDSELVTSILASSGYTFACDEAAADVILLNTCAIREGAEQKVWGKLRKLKSATATAHARHPVIGVLGCMAERLKDRLLESQLVQVVAGPDAYRDLPRLLQLVREGATQAMNVQLSAEETYADVAPVRSAGSHAAFVSIMRGCNNMCSFCVVPYTRGRERSRMLRSIVAEVRSLSESGVKEVTLLGQNVNSYADFSASTEPPSRQHASADRWYAKGFQSVYKPNREGAKVFAELLDEVAAVDPNMRIRFMSPHPKDFGDDCLAVIASHHNICKHLHMPAQSGSSRMLSLMRRGYDRESYDALLERAGAMIPGVTFSTDIIVGFCGETDDDHQQTLDLLQKHRFSVGYLFAYSDRERTHAARHYKDDVPPEVKKQRLSEAMAVFKDGVAQRRRDLHGTEQLVLVEGPSKTAPGCLTGRSDGFQTVRITSGALVDKSCMNAASEQTRVPKPGDHVAVRVQYQDGRLIGAPREITSLSNFSSGARPCFGFPSAASHSDQTSVSFSR